MKQIVCPDCYNIITVKQLTPGETVQCTACHHDIVTVPQNYNPQEAVRCPYCGEQIASDEPAVICPICKIEHHIECWQDNKGCTTYGCEKHDCLKPKMPQSPPPQQTTTQSAASFNPGLQNSIPQPTGSPSQPNAALTSSNKAAVKRVFLTIVKVLGYTFLAGLLCLALGLVAMGIGLLFTTIGSLITALGVFLRDLVIVVEDNASSYGSGSYSFKLQYYSLFGFLIIGILINIFSSTIKKQILKIWSILKEKWTKMRVKHEIPHPHESEDVNDTEQTSSPPSDLQNDKPE